MNRFWTFVAVLVVSFGLLGCASRIQKQPVSRADEIRAHRHTIEGDQLLRAGKDHLALLSYLEASVLDPYNEVVFNKLAIAYARLQQFEQAKRASDRAVRLEPTYSFAHNTRGIIFLGLQKMGNAIQAFEKAIELSPETPAFFINLGSAHLNLGNFADARWAYQRALKLDPEAFRLNDTLEVAAVHSEAKPAPERNYQMAKVFAELGDKQTSLYYLSKALEDGFRDGERLATDSAFKVLRQDDEFLTLVRSFGIQI